MRIVWIADVIRGNKIRQMGDAARDKKNWSEAASHYSRYLELAPDNFGIWVQLGHARKESGDLAGAHQAYTRAKCLNDSDADLLLNFGRLQKLRGEREDALELLSQSYKLDGNTYAQDEINALLGESGKFHRLHRDGIDDGQEREKIIRSGYFDPSWYEEKYPDIGTQGALQHFCMHGAFEGRSPGPHFDTEWYLLQNPDLLPGVTNRVINPLIHFIDHGRLEGRSPAPKMGTLEAVRSLVDSIYDIDPDIYTVTQFASELGLKSLRTVTGVPTSRAFLAFKRLFATLTKPYDYIVAVPWLKHGGADRVALHLATAISELVGKGSVLIVACDFSNAEAVDWLPSGIDLVILPGEHLALRLEERVDALTLLLQAIRPKAVINVNSHTCWEMFRHKGRPLSQLMRLYGCAFCRDYSHDHRASGYADTHLREPLPWLSGLISDNASFFDELTERFALPSSFRSRFIKLYNPAPQAHTSPAASKCSSAELPAKEENEPFKVLWASRLAPQKNLDLLKRIVAAAPDMHFDVWGRGEAEDAVRQWVQEFENVEFKGSFANFFRLPLRQYDSFLYTSLWDGIPNVLLEAAAAGLPLVASRVGGIHELIDDRTGWLIDDVNAADLYVTALRQIRADGEARKRKLGNMRKRLSEQHNWASFKQVLISSGVVEGIQ